MPGECYKIPHDARKLSVKCVNCGANDHSVNYRNYPNFAKVMAWDQKGAAPSRTNPNSPLQNALFPSTLSCQY